MTHDTPRISRRTALRTVAGISSAAVAGCLSGEEEATGTQSSSTSGPDEQSPLKRVGVDGTALVVEFASEAEVDQVNLIQPDGELFGTRDAPAGVEQVSFELGTSYTPGEYEILALSEEETIAETSFEIRPKLEIREVGLFRNHPEKPWDEVYGESETNRIRNGEAFVTVENSGTGPEAVVELRFAGGVPNPIENPRGSGIHEKEQVIVPAGESLDLYSNSFPFGAEIGKDGLGCSQDGNSGQFSVITETRVDNDDSTKEFNVEYSGSEDMSDCDVTISEV
ncbi:hypothetical protein [Haloarchaeobius amylolyticus]|uniref:hypothetical protein n=1 Tax=Haloarchaeobius amylolyticus TaxID=1198296 RepID=UPI00226F35D1|nr:hypothetical protein [Haloarchaeobius amylolyticus]